MSAKRIYETLDDGKSTIPVSRADMKLRIKQGKFTVAERILIESNVTTAMPWEQDGFEDRIWVRVTGVTAPILRRLYPDKAAKA